MVQDQKSSKTATPVSSGGLKLEVSKVHPPFFFVTAFITLFCLSYQQCSKCPSLFHLPGDSKLKGNGFFFFFYVKLKSSAYIYKQIKKRLSLLQHSRSDFLSLSIFFLSFILSYGFFLSLFPCFLPLCRDLFFFF